MCEHRALSVWKTAVGGSVFLVCRYCPGARHYTIIHPGFCGLPLRGSYLAHNGQPCVFLECVVQLFISSSEICGLSSCCRNFLWNNTAHSTSTSCQLALWHFLLILQSRAPSRKGVMYSINPLSTLIMTSPTLGTCLPALCDLWEGFFWNPSGIMMVAS